MGKRLISAAALLTALGFGTAASATTYTSDSNLAHFVKGQFATFSDFNNGDVSAPFTPTAAGLLANGYRVWGGTLSADGLTGHDNYILATFGSATANIEVIANIDHYGTAYDGYQYAVFGSNDGTHFTQLYDTLTVAGSGEPYTIGSYTGIAPYLVNNVLTPSVNNPQGTPGYEAFFNFGTAYKYYAFGASTEAMMAGNADQEFSGVLSTPEPSTWAMMGLGFAALGFAGHRARKARVAFA